jgi:hypothetical protein
VAETPNIIEFERLVRAYVAGEVRWDTVHEYAVEMEWASTMNFPAHVRKSLEDLHTAFLSDERDDPQFRLDRSEIAKLVHDLDQSQGRQRKA